MQFVDSTEDAGMARPVTPSYGLSAGDVNGDGWPDVFFNDHALPNSIWVNDGDGTYTDATSDVDAEGFWSGQPGGFEDTHGGSWIDFDNDGDQDLLILTGDCCDPHFMENVNGQLFNRTQEFGLDGNRDRGGRTPVWFDVRNDGVPEVAMTTFHATTLLERTGNQFNTISGQAGFTCNDSMYAVLVDINDDDHLDVICVSVGGPFVRGAFDITTMPFTDVSGLIPSADGVNDIVLGDYDNNLANDMLLLTGALRPSETVLQNGNIIESQWINRDRSLTFNSDGTLEVDLSWNRRANMSANLFIGASGVNPNTIPFTLDPTDPQVEGILARDPNDTGSAFHIGFDPATDEWTFQLYSGAEFNSSYLIVESSSSISSLQTSGDIARDQPQPPVLLSNLPGSIEIATAAAGLDDDIYCVSGVSADFDNDMDQDIYLACRGGVRNVANILLENDGTGSFTAVADAAGAAGPVGLAVTEQAGTADSVVSADVNLDGRMDLIVANGLNIRPIQNTGGPVKLFTNQSAAGNWLLLDLQGTNSTRDAIGAVVTVTAGGVTQMREQNDGYHRWSQNHRRIHFGLADNVTAQVVVDWPSGLTETYDNVDANAWYNIVEGDGIFMASLPTGRIQFNDSGIDIGESAGSVTVTVTRSGGDSGAATVGYETRNGSATSGTDYSATSGTLSWADGESGDKTFDVSITDDNADEPAESFVVRLIRPDGAPLGTIVETVVTISDNDNPAPPERRSGGGGMLTVYEVLLIAGLTFMLRVQWRRNGPVRRRKAVKRRQASDRNRNRRPRR